jgi:hypothetical protein
MTRRDERSASITGARRVACLLAACLPLVSCASSPGAAPAVPAPAPAEPATSNVICHPGAKQAVFTELGVPGEETPVDVAIAEPYVYVLFQPARLLRLKLPSQGEGGLQVQMQLGRDEIWSSMDVDPRDGSLWIAGNHFVLRHFTPQGGASTVPLQRVAGDGGFNRLMVAADAIYAAPVCAEDGLWRIDRQGKILSSTFPYDPGQDAAGALEPGAPRALAHCGRAWLMRGRGGAAGRSPASTSARRASVGILAAAISFSTGRTAPCSLAQAR